MPSRLTYYKGKSAEIGGTPARGRVKFEGNRNVPVFPLLNTMNRRQTLLTECFVQRSSPP
jgi:hypothetical protein